VASRPIPRRLPDDLKQVRIDGNASDAGWRRAREQKILLHGVDGTGPTEVVIKSIYHDDAVYFLLMWRDEKLDQNNLCRFEKPGRWKMTQGEDAAMLLFAPAASAEAFRANGFNLFVKGDAFRNTTSGGFADAWYWGAQTTRYQHRARDHWLRPNQGMRGDSQPDDSDNVANWATTHEGPARVPRRIAKTHFAVLTVKDSIALTQKRMESMDPKSNFGWTVPAFLARRMQGSRADVHASARHVGRGWVLELARKLDTGQRDDLVLGDPLRPALFAIAIWDGGARGVYPADYGLACTRSGAIELQFLSES